MARKQSINKIEAVRDYVNAHPAAIPSEIAAALNRQGIKITSVSVATIKMWIHKTAAPPIVETPANTLTRDQIKKVARAMKKVRSR